jgi:hypothetical protein
MKSILKLLQPDLKKQMAEAERKAKENYYKSEAGIAAGYEQEDDLIDEVEKDRQYKLRALRRLRGE